MKQMGKSMEGKKASQGRHILVVEDNEINLNMILDMLSIHNHKVTVARNGMEAIESAKQHKPELVLMDMRMPVMGGLEATEKIRTLTGYSSIPIIALTASTGTEAEERQIKKGCTEYLAKPIQTKELFEVLTKHLEA